MTETRHTDLIEAPRQAIDGTLEKYLQSLNLPPRLSDSIRYALLSGGKRLRPVLAWYCAQAAGGDGSQSLAGGGAVELIHAFSLVHDDLPAMDDDDLRRGQPTLHIHAGEPMAILAGDAMLTFAFDIILRDRTLSSESKLAIINELTTGATCMIAGQVYDTLGGLDETLSPEAQLASIHRNKTGALLRASCRIGVLSAAGSEKDLSVVTCYAEAVGLMFQIVDDLMDVEQTSEHAGKRTGKDEDAGKLTYPAVIGVDASWKEVDRLAQEAHEAASTFGEKGMPLIELAEYMANRTQ